MFLATVGMHHRWLHALRRLYANEAGGMPSSRHPVISLIDVTLPHVPEK
jgi:hypothetical protein